VDRETLEQLLAQGLSLAEIGRRCSVHESTVAAWLTRHGLRANGRSKHSSRGCLARPQLATLVREGLTIAEIAATVGVSKTTARYWLKRHGLKTSRTYRPKPAGPPTLTMECPRHGHTEFCREGRGYYRCRLCRSAAVSRRRRKVKAILVAEAGGRCAICGYSRSMRALSFHHLDPSEKRYEINARGVALALERLRLEARKCVLLCSNCHAEVEDGLVDVPSSAAAIMPAG